MHDKSPYETQRCDAPCRPQYTESEYHTGTVGEGALSVVRGSTDACLCKVLTILQEKKGYGAQQAS
jgi:hypothetical protein